MRDKFDKNAKFEIVEHIATLSERSDGWTLEFNKVKWGDRAPMYEIRRWGKDHSVVGKGTTLYENELPLLLEALLKAVPKQ